MSRILVTPQPNNGMHPTRFSGSLIQNLPLITSNRGG